MKDFYGDDPRWFIGDVIDTSPPFGLEGRIKIRIHGVHSPSTLNIPQSDLPWAQCVLPSTEGGSSGIGRKPNIQPGSLCFGIFLDGKDSQIPLVVGTIPRIEFPSEIQQIGVVSEHKRIEDFYNQSRLFLLPSRSDIDDNNTGELDQTTREARIREGIKFFINAGYTTRQSVGIVSNLNMQTGETGIAAWKGQRLNNLKSFSNEWRTYSRQLLFILYELNSTQTDANVSLFQSDTLRDKEFGCQVIFAKKFLKLRTITQNQFNRAIDLFDNVEA